MSRRLRYYKRHMRLDVSDTMHAITMAHTPGSVHRTAFNQRHSTSEPIKTVKAIRIAQALHRRSA